MFDNETETVEKFGQNIIATIKMRIGNMKRFALINEETIVNKRENGDRNVESFEPFFQDIKKRRKVR